MRRVTLVVVACAAACVALRASQLIQQVQLESERYRQILLSQSNPDREKQLRSQTKVLHEKTFEWIRPHFPLSKAALASTRLPRLQKRLNAELEKATKSNVAVVLSRPAQHLLSLKIGIDNGCGSDEALFVFDYTAVTPRLILEDHPQSSWGESVVFEAAGPILLTQRFGINCGSTWYVFRYALYRAIGSSTHRIHEDQHSVWFGFGDNALRTRLSERELRMDIRDRSIDTGIHNRPHVLRLAILGDTVTREDPVALHPRDFVDEWINRPWSEMASRTESPGRLRPVHEQLHRDAKFAEFDLLQHCSQIPSTWQIGLHRHFFLVRDLGKHSYRMIDISTTRQPGCPGQGNAIEVEVLAPK